MRILHFLAIGLLLMATKPLLAQSEKQIPTGSQSVTVWDGTSWSNGLPDTSTKALFAADFLATEAWRYGTSKSLQALP